MHCKSILRTPQQKINNGISCGLRSKMDHLILNNDTTCDWPFVEIL